MHVEGRDVGALVLCIVILRDGAGRGANGRGGVGADVGTAGGGGTGSGDNAGDVVEVAAVVAAFNDGMGVGGAGTVDDAVAVAAATFDGGVGVGGAGIVNDAGVGEGGDDECDDDDSDSKSDGDGAKLAVGAADAGIVRDPIAVAVVGTRVQCVRGFGLSLAIVEGVC